MATPPQHETNFDPNPVFDVRTGLQVRIMFMDAVVQLILIADDSQSLLHKILLGSSLIVNRGSWISCQKLNSGLSITRENKQIALISLSK